MGILFAPNSIQLKQENEPIIAVSVCFEKYSQLERLLILRSWGFTFSSVKRLSKTIVLFGWNQKKTWTERGSQDSQIHWRAWIVKLLVGVLDG